jgi:molybdopterin synthase sulfur carrier subunit
MKWRLFATLAETAGRTEIPVNVETEATLRDAFDALLDAQPELTGQVLDDGDLHDHVRLLVDGTNPFAEADGWDTAVDSNSAIALFPPVSGG